MAGILKSAGCFCILTFIFLCSFVIEKKYITFARKIDAQQATLQFMHLFLYFNSFIILA